MSTPNTFQMVIHESTGIVEIFTEQKACIDGSNTGDGIQGMQNWNRNAAVLVPGRNPSFWTENNTGFRFIPSAGTSRYLIAEMLDMGGAVVATADTLTTVAGMLDIRFTNFCTPPGSTQYVVRTQFSACDNPVTILTSLDTITINRTNSLNATAVTTNASCGPPDGTITVTVPPGVGTPPYTYVLDGGAPVVGPSPYTFVNVAAGPHTIVVTDASAGCTSTINVTVILSGNIPATTTTTPTACPGVNDGSITITSAGGSGPYTFSLDGGAPVPGTIPFTFTNLSAGNHTIVVTDVGLGCSTVIMNVNVPAGIGITGNVTSTPTTCPGATNGTVTATALTGVAPFTWQLDAGPIVPGANPYTFTNVAAGAHVVRITDNLGCIAGFNINVGAGPGITGSTSSTATSCAAANNGTITATALTGTAPFTWSLDGAPPVAGASPYTFTNVPAGLHTVTIMDNGGCNVILNETVAAGTGNTGSTSSTATSCPGVSNGTITATALTGTAPFTWSLDGAPPVPGASPFTFTNVPAGLHTVTITDNVGCNVSLTETVAAGTGNTGTTSSTATSCPGVSNGTITATALTGTAPFTWSLDGAPPVPGASPFTFTNVPAGLHTVTITDNVGCNVSLTETVAAGAGNTGSTSSTATSCTGVSNGTITATALTGTAPFTWSLDGAPPVAGASPYTFTNVPAGIHTVTITDNVGCNVSLTETVSVGAGNTGSTSSTATSCTGVSNGTITATALTGTAPFTWSLDGAPPVAGASPYTFTNVPAGIHTVTITDNVGCNVSLTETVAVGAGNTGSTSSTATSCTGVSNGTITATALTGTAPFTWSLDGAPPVAGASPYTFTNVPAGIHTVTITDNVGCNVSLTETVAVGAGNTGTTSSTATSCPIAPNGTITATALTGTAPFTWSLDGAPAVPGASPYTFINVPAGVHTVTITDIVGCNVSLTETVAPGPNISYSSTTVPASCTGVNDGTITATALTGTAPFTWSIDGGPVVAGSPYTFINLSPGTHTVVMWDAFGCNVSTVITVGANTPTSVLSSTATACAGVNTGTVTVTAVVSMAGPYTFSLDGGAAVPGTLPFTFLNVAAGSHSVVVNSTSSGCSTVPNTVIVATGPGVSGNATSTATSCPTASNGTVTADATAGIAPFTYSLDGGPPQSGANPYTFINVAAGPHSVLITDNVGCNITINVNVTAGPPLAATVNSNATTCSGASDGTITITPTNGIAPYTYALDGGPAVPGGVPYTFTNVPAGNHTVQVTDAAGCVTGSIAVVVNAGPVLTTTVTVTDALCNGGATGIITVTQPVIGAPPYQYSLDGITWQASNIFNGLAAGNYTVYYRESLGCQGSQTVTVAEPAAMSTSATTVAAVCNGDPNGTITITAGGGTPPYQYSIDGGVNWQGGNTFTVAAGVYSIIIRDANNCTVTQTATVTEPAVLTASSANTNASCNGGNDGVITVTANGGNTGGYQYSLDGITWQPSNTFNVAPGNYTVYVRDNLNCTTNFPTVVGLNNNLVFTPQTDPTICEGSSTPLNFVSNATAWTWTPATGLSNPAVANPTADPTVTTQYIVTATLDRCSTTDTVIVNVNTAPVPNAGAPGFICYGQTYQLNGSGGMQYSWTPSTYLNNPSLPNPISAATKTITYTLSIVADLNGCSSLVTDDVTVDVTPPVKIYTFPADTILYPGDRIQFRAVSAVPSANIFNWTPNLNISNPNVYNPDVTAVNIGDSIVYKVTASSAAGCTGEAYVRFRVYKGPELYVPTAFTPNGDGLNDRFYPFPVGIKAINYFRVFNRWGQQIFSSTTLYKGWDGKLQGVDQPSGVYVWMAQGIDKDNKAITRQGTVTVIR